MRAKSNIPMFLACVATVLGGIGLGGASETENPKHPCKSWNILVLMADDLNADRVGIAGDPVVKTPRLDSLARSGARLPFAFCNRPLCQPSRASFLTGRLPRTTRSWENGTYMTAEETTIAEVLHQHGYVSGQFGKFHSPSLLQGFDEYARHLPLPPGTRVRHAPFPELKGQLRWNAGDYPDPKETHPDYRATDAAIDFMRRHKDRPFFCYLNYAVPHQPYTPPAPYSAMYDPKEIPLPPRKRQNLEHKPRIHWHHWIGHFHFDKMTDDDLLYVMSKIYGEITFMDDEVGRILDELRKLGLEKRTIVLFTSDHGEFLGAYHVVNKGPFFYDPLMRMPFYIRAPGAIPENRVPDGMVEIIDMMPTLLDLVGIPIPPGVQGKSFGPMLIGATSKHKDVVYAEFGSRVDGPETNTGWRTVMLRTKKWKYCRQSRKEFCDELYDLVNDPHEMTNVIDNPEHKELVNDFRLMLLDHELWAWDTMPFSQSHQQNGDPGRWWRTFYPRPVPHNPFGVGPAQRKEDIISPFHRHRQR